ncbi:MAG: sel1 repeat family protein [Alphaproteobacteria bacterium]|nr:sel1 repeat family protein [Alphaproteobacteria bacterium]
MVLIRQGNVEAGIDMLRRIGELGNAEAFFYLAEINRTGDVKEASEQVSMMYYRLASQMGNKKASLNLANILFFDGSGSRAEVEEALAIWQQYAMLGDIESIYLLGMLYWNGEGGQVPDPIRGYGLIWRAAEAGYPPAQETEPAMREQLNADAIAAGQTYASDFEVKGFDNKPLDIHLVTDQEIAIPEPDEVEKPTDWTTVWRLEVGFAMSREDTEALQKDIYAKKKGAVEGLHSEIIEAPNRPGLYRLLFGPIGGMQNAVSKCVDLKRGGFDCFAKPPR